MAATVYILCALTSLACAFALLRMYFRARSGMLLWSGIGFTGFFLNNTLLFIDLVVLPGDISLAVIRTLPGLIGVMAMALGIIWEANSG